MKAAYIYLILLILCSCNFAQNKNVEFADVIDDTLSVEIDSISYEKEFIVFDSAKSGLNFKNAGNYQATKYQMIQLRNKLSAEYSKLRDSISQNKFLDSVSLIFSDKLLNEIIPYWYGTEYDFSGYTSKPNQGRVGCSYFVSTSMLDLGLNLNRYKLAQQNPENEAISLAIIDKNLSFFIVETKEQLIEMLPKIEEGLYFVGLSSHVGYFYKNDGVSYFIHANYIEGFVNIELAETSYAFNSYVYYFTKISFNRELSLKWIQNQEIQVVKATN